MDKTMDGIYAQTDHDLLTRIDERTSTLHTAINDVKCSMSAYVTRKEFAPVKSIVYGVVGILGTSVMGAIAFLIFKR